MATTEKSVPVGTIDIHPDHDFIIHVTEKADLPGLGHDEQTYTITRKATVHVVRATLEAIAAIPGHPSGNLWQSLFRDRVRRAREDPSSADLTVTSLDAAEILLRVCHGTLTDESYEAEIDEMWHLAELCEYLNTDHSVLFPFFSRWYERYTSETRDLEDHQQLLWPIWYFDEAKGFLKTTKYVVYEYAGHIAESNPTKLARWHLPPRLIQQLNAARGRLKTVLDRDLWVPGKALLKAGCTCAPKTYFNFHKAMTQAGFFPLDAVFPMDDMQSICDRMDRFQFTSPPGSCVSCLSYDLGAVVSEAQADTETYFNGLCRDCEDKTKTPADTYDDDYLHHTKVNWDFGCRVKHGQPTWWFSFCGRHSLRQGISNKLDEAIKKRHKGL